MSTAEELLDVLVVGAGLSGLALAWNLKRAGCTLLICQAGERVGGAITTALTDGFVCEGGPSSFQESPALIELLTQLQLEDQIVTADPRLARFVWWENRLRSVPLTPPQLVRSDLLSWSGKARLLWELFVPALGEPREETVAEFVLRRFGEEVLSRLVDPLVSGMCAGDVGQLSVEATFEGLVELERRHGGVLRGLWRTARTRAPLKRLCTLRGGLEQLPQALAQRLQPQLLLSHRLEALERLSGDHWRAVVAGPQGEPLAIAARTVILAGAAHAMAPVLRPLDAGLGRALESIYYPPVASINLGYSKSQVPNAPEGFGHLIPRNQTLRSLGVIWNSSLFPHTAPPNWRLYTCFVGGTTDPATPNLSDTELASLAHRELQTALGFQAGYQLLRVTRWPQAIPQYALGHPSKQERVERALLGLPGLFLAGNYFGGISLGDCVRHSGAVASRVLQFLSTVASNGSLRPA
ncbi:protoporphyrinogen oxidase [Gloeobacter morelensis]|uniref:Coproporphyrinogen III oxidase n=1 Tax=Gloeobacter morelensis MG652769 TaxID=2781736 RepID=A0ABY3PJ55_9CYAN|nr:protoporphyrinogen oxidase [Gloeobacter morelensis]UFP93649.1 protoporphyrinogen oxidase [Gloeobacter morelensis MG652769]